MDIEIIDLTKLDLQDDDILLVRLGGENTPERQDNCHRVLTHALAAKGLSSVLIVIGSKDDDFSVLRKAAA